MTSKKTLVAHALLDTHVQLFKFFEFLADQSTVFVSIRTDIWTTKSQFWKFSIFLYIDYLLDLEAHTRNFFEMRIRDH